MAAIDHIIQRAISPSAVRSDGYLTHPRSYGVYRIPSTSGSTRRFRFGNHPVRMRELEAEFGSCKLEHLFSSREDAKTVALALSGTAR
jgi:hypothetical protein